MFSDLNSMFEKYLKFSKTDFWFSKFFNVDQILSEFNQQTLTPFLMPDQSPPPSLWPSATLLTFAAATSLHDALHC